MLQEELGAAPGVEPHPASPARPLRFYQSQAPRHDVAIGGAGTADVAPASQQVVVVENVLQSVVEYRGAIREWFGLVREGGFLVLTVPSSFLFERKLMLPATWTADQRRLYTPGSLLAEVEEALVPNTYRVRHLAEDDTGYDYARDTEERPVGKSDLTLVIERIAPPAWTLAGRPAPPPTAPMPLFEPVRDRVERTRSGASHRILVLKLDHLGDFIMGIAALERLRETFPAAAITLVVGSWNRDLAAGLGIADTILSFDIYPRNSSEEKVDVVGKTSAFQGLVTGKYDIAIDLRTDGDTRFLLQSVDADLRCGLGTKAQFRHLDIFLPIDTVRHEPETARDDSLAPGDFQGQGYTRRTRHRFAVPADRERHDAAIIWGPYWNLRPGRYVFEPYLEIDPGTPGFLFLDIAISLDRVASRVVSAGDPLRFEFDVEKPGSVFEFRVYDDGGDRRPAFDFFGGRLMRQGASSVLHQSEYLILLIELIRLRVERFGILYEGDTVS
ncbi:MAG: hypothetical protein JWL91_4 [Sphingomonas bacterium]|nr:hypothetical protein [Sphingomonas bacterium]